MKNHDDNVYIKHILDDILKIEESFKSLSKSDFLNDECLIDATVRRIEIMGEAVKNISNEFKEKYNKIEWRKIAGMRDILIHAYFKVDLEAVWIVVKKDIPLLKENILNIKRDLENKNQNG